ncbi:hypothetical protein DITRI_Ditri12bG0019700 [Diplodiscus trichospermus]
MGNCLTSNKVLAENDQDDPQGCRQAEAITGKVTVSNLERAVEVADGGVKVNKKKEKKVVRFKLNEENNVDRGKHGESNNGVVRIRLVVTHNELKQILSCSKDHLKHSSMEQLIKVVKLRGTRISEAGRTIDDDDDGFHGAWRPALESIPEEH